MGYLIQRQIRQHLQTHWPKITTGDHTQLMVLYTLADHADEGDATRGATVTNPGGTRRCHPSIETITRQGVASRRQVLRAIQELREKGYVTTHKHPQYSTNVYTVVDMVAGKELVDNATSTATMAVATELGLSVADAERRLSTMVSAWEAAYREEHEGCGPVPQVLAEAINDIAAALIATSRGQTAPTSGATPQVKLRSVNAA